MTVWLIRVSDDQLIGCQQAAPDLPVMLYAVKYN